MRVGVNTLFLVPGDVGGTETYLRETLLAAVKEYPDVEFILYTNRENDSLFKKLFAGRRNVRNTCLKFRAAVRPLRIVLEQLWLPIAVWRSKVDVLWSPGYTAPFFVPCPQVVTVHDLQYKSHPDDLSPLEKITLDGLVRIACRQCARIVTVSQFSKEEILRFGFAPAEKVIAVLEGVDRSFGEPVQDPSVVAELRLPATVPFILCVAHTYPHKNVHRLIEAFSMICHEIPHNLVIVGKERLGEPAVRHAIAGMPCPDRLYRFQNGVSFGALRYLYQQADIFVLPSAYEGFGLPVLEAMMAGTPVVTSRMASLPEVAGDFAFYYEKADARSIADSIKSAVAMTPEHRIMWCNRARAWAESFTWQETARKLNGVFNQLA